MVDVAVGDQVRVYEDGGWFWEGEVTFADGREVLIDFDDWVERFEQGSFHKDYALMREVLVAAKPGERIREYGQTGL